MDCDVAVLGGGPAATRPRSAPRSSARRSSASRRSPSSAARACASAASRPRRGCRRRTSHQPGARRSSRKLGVKVGEPRARLRRRRTSGRRRRQADDRRRRIALQGERRRVGEGHGPLQGREHDRRRGRGGRDASRARSSRRARSRSARRSTGLDSARCVDSTGLLAQTEVPRRLVVLGGGIIGCEFASIFQRFGTEVTIVEMLAALIPHEDADAAKELAKQFGKRGIALQLGKQCTKVEDDGGALTVHFGEGETVEADLMLVAVGRGPLVEGLGLEETGVGSTGARASRPTSTAARPCRTSTPSATAPATGSSPTPRSARARSRPRTPAATTPSSTTAACRGRSTPIRRSPGRPDRGAGARAVRRRRRRRPVPVGRERARGDAGRDGRLGQVDPRDALRRAARARHGRPARDRPDRGRVVAIDAEATVETVADGMAPTRRSSEAIKEAGLVALGRAIHMPEPQARAAAKA